jgi:transcription-repair coupling factor (superfamily II helicase)
MIRNVLDKLLNQPIFEDLVERIGSGDPPPLVGLPRAARLPVLAAVRESLDRPVLLLTDKADRTLVLEDELRFWDPELNISVFPEPDPLYYEKIPWTRTTRRDRLKILAALAREFIPGVSTEEKPGVILAPIRALMTRTLPRRVFLSKTRVLRTSNKYSLQKLAGEWVQIGYEYSPVVTAPGQFARRGGILDVWPPGDHFPARIEFFGEEIEMLRRFDPENQATIQIVETLVITPAREFILPDDRSDLDLTGEEEISEYHIPLLHQEVGTLMNYLPNDCLVFLDDQDAIRSGMSEIVRQAESLRAGYQKGGSIFKTFPLPYQEWKDLSEVMKRFQPLALGPYQDGDQEGLPAMFSANQGFGGELKVFISHLRDEIKQGDHPVVVSRQAPRLEELWEERPNAVEKPFFIKGSIEGGWIFTPQDGKRIKVYSDQEIFGWRRIQPRRRPVYQAQAPEIQFSDYREDDWVVHIDHGIGRYAGLVTRFLDGIDGEYLAVEYDEGDLLFVPASQADRLTRYVGPDHHDPRITRLGSGHWRATKTRVKNEVIQVAQDLLELYARRETTTGFAFNQDTAWQEELEASFPYIETEDQLQVMSQVKRDMEEPKPMDRLICGDVGYGKTEIAIRAAFKAVMDGKQVAVLVPTTVLAQQHYDTFLERMGGFPVEIRMLSRFRTPKQQREILNGLVKGAVDIVIGTHRLLSSDVIFHDLGLMIVDEEQRFGVNHKEQIKSKRTDIDVLTMTATPIPRTMYMALTGVRDISRINTPPEERLPVVTHVSEYDPDLIQKAIWRELERGGQVFFVHNRVKTINAVKSHISRLVPEARIGIAHGQMPENKLADRMREFTTGEIDVLLSTSIIESGLDIPNANTLIVDRADMFGLAQLYQLRGRVGRGAQRAYAYFFKDRQGSPTEEGKMRLETIGEHTSLGAGYSIALRDLEIRGSGDILGTRQSGYIAAVGFHLYTRLLSDAVKRVNPESGFRDHEEELPFQILRPLVRIDLPLPSGIPQYYIQDPAVRLSLYRRGAAILNPGELKEMRGEFKDRFGPLPEPVENFLQLLEIKLYAELAGIESVSVQAKQINLGYPEGKPLPQSWDFESRVRFGESSVWLPLDLNSDDWVSELISILKGLTTY